MNPNIYPRNYFTPYDDLKEPEEIPACIKADNDAHKIIESLAKRMNKASMELKKRIDYDFIYKNFKTYIELELAEILEELYKLRGDE